VRKGGECSQSGIGAKLRKEKVLIPFRSESHEIRKEKKREGKVMCVEERRRRRKERTSKESPMRCTREERTLSPLVSPPLPILSKSRILIGNTV